MASVSELQGNDGDGPVQIVFVTARRKAVSPLDRTAEVTPSVFV